MPHFLETRVVSQIKETTIASWRVCKKKTEAGFRIRRAEKYSSDREMSRYCLSEKTMSPVNYLPLVPARRFLLPFLDSDLGAQSMWYPLYLLSLESRVQEVPNLSVVFGWWNYSKRHSAYIIIAMYPWMCFCIITRLNFCVGAKFRNGTYKNPCRNCVVMHCKSKPPVPGPKQSSVCNHKDNGMTT